MSGYCLPSLSPDCILSRQLRAVCSLECVWCMHPLYTLSFETANCGLSLMCTVPFPALRFVLPLCPPTVSFCFPLSPTPPPSPPTLISLWLHIYSHLPPFPPSHPPLSPISLSHLSPPPPILPPLLTSLPRPLYQRNRLALCSSHRCRTSHSRG